MGERARYRAYLLRLWEVHREGQTVWRASLESPGSGERRAFATLDRLCAFLHEQGVPLAGTGDNSGSPLTGNHDDLSAQDS
ncbi:MAG: hypothetical protein M3220_19595 [Chloroflexota bacterium]|nr:hypothetical protein [Chloroflexota bacterium]